MIPFTHQMMEDWKRRPDVSSPVRSNSVYETFRNTPDLLAFVTTYDRYQCPPVTLDMCVESVGLGPEGLVVALRSRYYIDWYYASYRRDPRDDGTSSVSLKVFAPTSQDGSVPGAPNPGDRIFVTKAVGLTYSQNVITAYTRVTQINCNF